MSVPAQFSRRVCFGEFELNLETAELKCNGSQVILPGQPFQLLVALLNRPGELVTREELKRRLWSADTFVDFDQSLNKAVNRLREALQDSAEKPRFIETLPRKGYRFIGKFQSEVFKTSVDGSSNVPTPPVTSPDNDLLIRDRKGADLLPADGLRKESPKGRGSRYLPVALTIVLVVATAAVLTILRVVSRSKRMDSSNLQIVKLTENGRVQGIAISGDGKFVAYSLANDKGESLHLREVSTQNHVELLAPGPRFHGLTFSPDGGQLFLVRSDEKDPFFKYLYSMPTFGGATRKLVSDVDSPVSFSPDGKHLVYEHCLQPKNDIELKIATVEGNDDRLLATLHDASGFLFQPGPSWSPDGETIAVPAFLLGKQELWVLYAVSVRDGTVRQLYTNRDGIGRPAWKPDSAGVVVPQYDRDARHRQLRTISFPLGEARTMTHDLSDYGNDLGITHDGRIIATTTVVANLNVWTVPTADPTYGRQITHSANPTFEIAEAFDGKLLTLVAGGVPWIMVTDGSQRRQFADLQDAVWLTTCGKFVVFQTNASALPALVRVDRDGTHITELVAGHVWGPACSADGQFVFYINTEQPQKIWRVSIQGG